MQSSKKEEKYNEDTASYEKKAIGRATNEKQNMGTKPRDKKGESSLPKEKIRGIKSSKEDISVGMSKDKKDLIRSSKEKNVGRASREKKSVDRESREKKGENSSPVEKRDLERSKENAIENSMSKENLRVIKSSKEYVSVGGTSRDKKRLSRPSKEKQEVLRPSKEKATSVSKSKRASEKEEEHKGMGLIKEITDDHQFQEELNTSSSKLVVVDFTATWCGPCQRIAPFYEQMSVKYPKANFVKIDVDKCQETAANQRVSVMPTFYFFRNKVKVDSIQGADPGKLEEKIKKYYDAEDASDQDVGVAGHMDLISFIMKNNCEALNESDDHPLAHCLTSAGGYLESDCDEQLIISIAFNQTIKLHSLKINAPADKGPKRLKIFINQPNTLDFDAASANQSVQDLELTAEDLEGINPVTLRYVKFQSVQNIQIFVQSNQGGTETTQIDYLQLIGSPIVTTNMSDFKRVTGKKGEAH